MVFRVKEIKIEVEKSLSYIVLRPLILSATYNCIYRYYA